MEVEYVVLPEDVLTLNEYLWDHPPRGRRKSFMGPSWVWLVVLVVLLGYLLLLSQGNDEPQALFLGPTVFIGLGVVALAVFLMVFRRPLLRRQVRRNLEQRADRNAKALGWRRVTLTPEGLVVASRYSLGTTYWSGIDKIVVARGRVLIFDSPTTAHAVPRRAFASDAEFREFVAMARDYRDMAQDAPPERRPARNRDAREPDTNITPDGGAER